MTVAKNGLRTDMDEKFGDELDGVNELDDSWERKSVGIGEKIDFSPGVIFIGTFNGTSTIETEKDGKPEVAKAFLFYDRAGSECFCWATHQLELALADVPTGKLVRIEHRSKKDIGGGRSVNNYVVAVKKS